MDTAWRIQELDCSGTTGPCRIHVVPNSDASGGATPVPRDAFLKTTHLLDPIQWMRGQYALPKESGLPWHRKAWQRAWTKLQDPWNQAYVETVAAYALGQLREKNLSPHFNIFYGAFCARAQTYRYNLTDDFSSYRHERWFWRGFNKNLFRISVRNTEDPTEPVPQDFLDEIFRQDLIQEGDESEDGSEEELSVPDIGGGDSGSLKSADSMNDLSYQDSSEHGSDSDEDDDAEDGVNIYADFENYPVMLIISERNSGTMDDLFDSEERGEDWDTRWSAWTFQVVAALSCAQTMFGFTHNDLHTNNIVWVETPETHIYYKKRDGTTYRVPTFGKIFRLIDFGRTILTINGQIFISDDFKDGNDAEGQYAFPPLVARADPVVPPNPSFDLARLAVSMLDGVFPVKPAVATGGAVLSQERGLTVRETVSPLYNLLWSWMIDDEGRNILVNPDGSERFPDFDLYKHIGAHVHRAIPAQQFGSRALDQFAVADVPAGAQVYSLFC